MCLLKHYLIFCVIFEIYENVMYAISFFWRKYMKSWKLLLSQKLSINLISHEISNNHNDAKLFFNNVHYIFICKYILNMYWMLS
jgi:hypothetical protein